MDDAPDIVELIHDYLGHKYGKNQIEIYATTEPEIALGVVDSYEIDVAIIDMRMPGINGYDLIQMMNGKVNSVVFISGWTKKLKEIPDKEEYQIISKPFKPKDIGNAVDRSFELVDSMKTMYDKLCEIERLILGRERYDAKYA